MVMMVEAEDPLDEAYLRIRRLTLYTAHNQSKVAVFFAHLRWEVGGLI